MTTLNLIMNLEEIHVLGSYIHSIDVQKNAYSNGSKKSEEFHTFQMREEKHENGHQKANMFCFFDNK
jgi:hypothetical protein